MLYQHLWQPSLSQQVQTGLWMWQTQQLSCNWHGRCCSRRCTQMVAWSTFKVSTTFMHGTRLSDHPWYVPFFYSFVMLMQCTCSYICWHGAALQQGPHGPSICTIVYQPSPLTPCCVLANGASLALSRTMTFIMLPLENQSRTRMMSSFQRGGTRSPYIPNCMHGNTLIVLEIRSNLTVYGGGHMQ